jgi:hypothetical protein
MPPKTAMLADPRPPLRAASAPVEPARGGRDRLLEAMVDLLAMVSPPTAAEALKALRLAYPDSPLALRLAALGATTGRFGPDAMRPRD